MVILLNNKIYKCNRIYKCICISLITCKIICKYYFSVMLQTLKARFHISLFNQHQFVLNQLDIKNQPFYPALKFKVNLEIPFLDLNTTLNFFNLANKSNSNNNNQYVSFSKQHLYYVNVQGLVKKANQIAYKDCDESFIFLL